MNIGVKEAPFAAVTDPADEIKKRRFIAVNPADNTATYSVTANAVALSDAVEHFSYMVTYRPTGDMTTEALVEAAGTVAVGDGLKSDASGKAVVTTVGADMVAQAVSAGGAGDNIVVRMFVL